MIDRDDVRAADTTSVFLPRAARARQDNNFKTVIRTTCSLIIPFEWNIVCILDAALGSYGDNKAVLKCFLGPALRLVHRPAVLPLLGVSVSVSVHVVVGEGRGGAVLDERRPADLHHLPHRPLLRPT